MSNFDEPIYKKLGYLQVVGRQSFSDLALVSVPTPEEVRAAMDRWRASAPPAEAWQQHLMDHWAKSVITGQTYEDLTEEQWGTPDEAIGSIGSVLVFGADYGDLESRILAYNRYDLEIFDEIHTIKHATKIAEPETKGDRHGWEQFRDRRHGRRKQRRGKK